MIPVALENLILCKKAVFKTAVVGRSGLCVLPVPEKVFIVITNFTYFNFVDFLIPDDITKNFDLSVHQLNFESPKSQNHFVIKDDIGVETLPTGVTILRVSGHYKEDVYLIHEQNVKIEIVSAPPMGGGAAIPGVAPNSLKPPNPPNGYGSDPATAIPQTVSEIYGGGVGEYQPLTRRFSPPSAATPFLTGSLKYPVVPATALNPTFVANSLGQRSYPIVNIGYVEVKRQLGAELFQTG